MSKKERAAPATALLLIDLQYDFCAYGTLAVPDGNAVIRVAQSLLPHFATVVATQDWHPANHQSFAANHPWRKPGQVIDLHGLSQVLWPVHCVQNTFGAMLVKPLDAQRIDRVVRKGTHPEVDSYSGFFDNGRRYQTELNDYLQRRGIDRLVIMGLATDYCVKYTVLDALALGYEVSVLTDGCRAVNLVEGDDERALAEMADAGARLTTAAAWLSSSPPVG